MAQTNEVYMDVPVVEGMAKQFMGFGDVLDEVGKSIGQLADVMKMTAWLSLGATAAIAAYLHAIEPNFKRAATKMRELSQDITDAVASYKKGDNTGSSHFR